MKIYLTFIKYVQETLLVISVTIMMVFPLVLAFRPETISSVVTQQIYAISHLFLFFVMMIRPLADIFITNTFIRPLVMLRKGAGVLSASIIVSFIFAKLIVDPVSYITSIGTAHYWSMVDYVVLAHMADLSAIVLLVTSNSFSKRILGSWWKIIQKLSYVYFYGSALYVFLTYGSISQLVALVLVTMVTVIAYIKNRKRKQLSQL